jgi:hypothetical protein
VTGALGSDIPKSFIVLIKYDAWTCTDTYIDTYIDTYKDGSPYWPRRVFHSGKNEDMMKNKKSTLTLMSTK